MKKLLFLFTILFMSTSGVSALSNEFVNTDSTVLGLSDVYSNPYYQRRNETMKYDFYDSDIVFKFTKESTNNKLDYEVLVGNHIEYAMQVCSSSTIVNVEHGTGSSVVYSEYDVVVDYIHNTGTQCQFENETGSYQYGTIYIIYLYSEVYTSSYNVGQALVDLAANDSSRIPESFTFEIRNQLKFTFNDFSGDFGFSPDTLPVYYVPSYIYYQRVNSLRTNAGLEEIDRESRITYETINDSSQTSTTIIEKMSSFFNSTINWFSNWLTNLLNGLKSLFVPEDLTFLEEFSTVLNNKLGFIYTIPTRIIDFVVELSTTEWEPFTSVVFPEIEVFGFKFWNSQTVDLSEAISIFRPYRYITDVVCVVLCLRTLAKWRETIFGGGN